MKQKKDRPPSYSAGGHSLLASDGRELRSKRTKAKIRHSAGMLFIKKGMENTTVDDIAAAAKISKATFYLHFSHKEDLILEYAEQRLRHAASVLPELLMRPSVMKAIEEMVSIVLKDRNWNPELVKS